MVIKAHEFIKKNSDKSSVSLREIRRFNIFYEFFYDYLDKRKQNFEKVKDEQIQNKEEEEFFQNLNHYKSQKYSINLSVFLCYYLRITNKEIREDFVKEMNKIFNEDDFLKIPKREENFIINSIKIDKGIAKNRALLENVFSLFVALNSKVPIFIVGKPGCSKSLSFQLVNKSMQGEGSESSFFKLYPKLLVLAFQGSMASTSKGVENIFNKARNSYKNLNATDKLKNISMIFFDEMGLAEHSPNNPLKVIHSKLEYDENEGDNKIAFLGISNWALDAAKMNRGISISIPELTEEDNQETSLIIGKSYDENLAEKYSQFYKDLGSIYLKYKNFLKENYAFDGKDDFHGNRDFYHLIKNFSRNIIDYDKQNNLNNSTLLQSAINSIERNFGGMNLEKGENSIQKFKSLLKEKYAEINDTKEYDVVQRTRDNITDLESRYLLIIAKSSVSMFLISAMLIQNKENKKNNEYSIYVGSKFKEDLNKEEYTTKIMNKIQNDMETGNLVILKDLEAVYPHMYDLFNQNFTVLGGRNYARLAVGNSTNTFSLVDDNFRCIVNVNIDKINEEEAPFLNRFEKQIISFEDILSKDNISLSKEIHEKLLDLININQDFVSINYSLKTLLINCDLDEIQALTYQSITEGKKTKEEIYDFILSKISLTLPQDIILSMKYGKFMRNNSEYADNIINYYKKGIHTNLAEFIKNLPNTKSVVYTFSNKMEKIKNLDYKKIKKIIIGMLHRDDELEKLIDEFLTNNNQEICVIQIMPEEGEFLNYIKYLIETKEKAYENKKNKSFIFIVHLFRITNDEINELNNININNKKNVQEIRKKILKETLSNSTGYYQIFIDNLNGGENLKIENILFNENEAIFNHCFDVKSELLPTLLKAITFMKYNISNGCTEIENENKYIELLIDYLQKEENEKLRELINKCFFRELKKGDGPDIIPKIFKDQKTNIAMDIRDISSLIKNKLMKIYRSMIYILFFKLEKKQFFSSLLFNEITKENQAKIKDKKKSKKIDILEKIYESYLESFEFNDGLTKIVESENTNKINIVLGFKYPGIQPIINYVVKEIKDNIGEKYRNNENNLRGILDDEKGETDKYFRRLNILDSSTVNIINQEMHLTKIINDNKIKSEKGIPEELFNLIKRDYFYYFLKKNINEKRRDSKDINKDKEMTYDMEETIKFLNTIFEARTRALNKYFKLSKNEKEINIISNLSKVFNYFESYSSEITKIIQIFIKISQQIPKLYEQIEEIITKKQIIFEISDRNPEYSLVVNESFFLSVDSILRVVITNEKIYKLSEEDSNEVIFTLIITYKEILQNALSLNNELTCRSKEAVSLQEILKLLDDLTNIGMLNMENLKEILKYFKDETRYINENDGKKLCENFENFYKFFTKFEESQNKKFDMYKTLNFICLNEYLKIINEDFRQLLFNKILEKNEMIKNSSQLVKILIENVTDINAKKFRIYFR